MFCGFLWLAFAVLSAESATTDEDCFRWDETSKDALDWQSDERVTIQLAPYKQHDTFVKSVTQFYGGLSQSALVDGTYGKGGVIGSSMAVFHLTTCNHRPEVIRVLIEETPSSRTFATLPLDKIEKPMDIGTPNMAIYGFTGAENNLREEEYVVVRYILENSRTTIKNYENIPHHIEFKASGSDEYVGLNCTESIDSVVALKMHIVPSFPTEFDVSNIFAVFGDSYLSKTEILLNCGFNTSVGCPGESEDQKLIGKKPGVRDTVLPRSMFKQTHRRKVQINFKRLSETVYFMDFVLPVKDGYATSSNPEGRNRFFALEWPFDRVDHKKVCVTQKSYPAMKQTAEGICTTNTSANGIQNARPKSPPQRSQCFPLAGYTFCHQNDQDPMQISRIYMGFCEMPFDCSYTPDSEPFMGYISLKPFGAALSNYSNSLAIYGKDAKCIDKLGESPEVVGGSAVAVTASVVSAVVVISGAIIGVIIGVTSGGTAAAAAASALLLKYGLEFQKRNSELEVNIQKMCSEEMIKVKHAEDLSLHECVEFIIATSSQQGEDDEELKEKSQALTSLQIKTKESVRKIKSMMSIRRKKTGIRRHFSRRASSRKTEPVPLTNNDIRILRDKAERSSNWSNDPDRTQIENMTVDEAAAIMLYTQECCMYRRLNAALRAHDLVELEPYLPFMKLLLSALYKLPLIKARVYRGVKLDLSNVYNALSNKWFSWWSFSSTTLDMKVLETPLFLGKEGDRTLFCIEALGVDIAAFSAMPNESEVLLLPGMRMYVMPGVQKEEDLWQFDVHMSKEAAPVIDYPHPGCQQLNMTLDIANLPVVNHDNQRTVRRGSDHDRRIDEQKTANELNWPSIPGCGVNSV